jgi:hypothetical protein
MFNDAFAFIWFFVFVGVASTTLLNMRIYAEKRRTKLANADAYLAAMEALAWKQIAEMREAEKAGLSTEMVRVRMNAEADAILKAFRTKT